MLFRLRKNIFLKKHLRRKCLHFPPLSMHICIHYFINVFYRSGISVSNGKWHHVCITWESSYGAAEAYKDGVLLKSVIGYMQGRPILPFGIWIIGQDQDSLGGGFYSYDAFHGSLTDVNVWNRVLDASEISTFANSECGSWMKGNYRAYNDFVPYGGVRKYKHCCKHYVFIFALAVAIGFMLCTYVKFVVSFVSDNCVVCCLARFFRTFCLLLSEIWGHFLARCQGLSGICC